MNRKTVTAGTLVLFTAAVFLAFYSNIIADSTTPKKKVESVDILENAIIIQGLDMESDTPPEEELHAGKIIYDENFDDAIIDYEKISSKKNENSPRKTARTGDYNADLLRKLQKEDIRWHVTKYKIKKGDNLWGISRKYGTDHRSIIAMNYIDDPDSLSPGNMLFIPHRNGIQYVIKKGDTITSISARYKTPVAKIVAHNYIGKHVHPGQKLFLPDAVQPRVRSIKNSAQRDTANIARAMKGTFAWPLSGKITSSFGNRIDPFTRKRKFHCGIDISAPLATPVKSSADGTVIFSGWKDGYGNMVVIKHHNGYITVYAHNKSNTVAEGDTVEKGQMIALSGMTGAVTGAHLHYEIRKYLTPLNPMRFLQ